jgi:hypothetical protein
MKSELAAADRRFFFFGALLCAAIIFLGFAPSYYLKSLIHAPPPLSALTIVHGVVFTAWVLLFVLQSALAGYGNPTLHRQLGLLGAVLFGAVISVGILTAVTAGRLGHAPPGAPAPLAFMVLPLLGIAGAASLVVLALANRLRTNFHKRYMLASLIALTPPALHRLAIGAGYIADGTPIALLAADLLLLGAIGFDFWRTRRIHPAYVTSMAVFAIVNLGTVWGFSSPHWLSFATWLARLT